MSLALSMIVRNAETTLASCLESARGLADEIVIADTGSADQTARVARDFGARWFSVPWDNDFAAARNRCLAEVHSAWVLSLDADERLDPGAAASLPALLARADVTGYLVPIWNYVGSLAERLWDRPARPNPGRIPAASGYPAYVEHENVRLFRRLPGVRFVGRVHESVGPSIAETRGTLARADLVIHHFGMVADPETRARKNLLYRELGRAKVREMPANAQAHFELGLVEFDNFHNDSVALQCLRRACELNPQFSAAWFFRGMAHLRRGEYEEALRSLKRAEATGADTFHVAEALGDACYNLGDFAAARRHYRHALERANDQAALEGKLGLTELRLGDPSAGLSRLQRALDRDPRDGEAYDRLVTAYVWLGRLPEAAAVAEKKLAALDPLPEFFLRAASIRGHLQDWRRVAELLAEGLRRFPDAHKLRQAWSELEARAGFATSSRRSSPGD